MLTWIVLSVGVNITYLTSFLFGEMKWYKILLITSVAIIGMMLVNAIIATIISKLLPNKCFSENNKFYHVSKKECKFYEKIGIRKWKDSNLELGKLNGFSKRNLIDPNNPEYLKRFILESKKGLLVHFVAMWASLISIFLLPSYLWLPTGLPIAITSFIINLFPVMIIRYNLPRLEALLKFKKRNYVKATD